MNTETLQDLVATTSQTLRDAAGAKAGARAGLALAERELRAAVDAVLLAHIDDPKKMGGNEATRDAFIRRETADAQAKVDAAAAAFAEAQAAAAVAQIAWDEAQAQVAVARGVTIFQHHGGADSPIEDMVKEIMKRLHRAGVRA